MMLIQCMMFVYSLLPVDFLHTKMQTLNCSICYKMMFQRNITTLIYSRYQHLSKLIYSFYPPLMCY